TSGPALLLSNHYSDNYDVGYSTHVAFNGGQFIVVYDSNSSGAGYARVSRTGELIGNSGPLSNVFPWSIACASSTCVVAPYWTDNNPNVALFADGGVQPRPGPFPPSSGHQDPHLSAFGAHVEIAGVDYNGVIELHEMTPSGDPVGAPFF